MTRLSSRSTRDARVWANHRLARVIFSQSSCCRSVAIADACKETRLLMIGDCRLQWISRHSLACGQTPHGFVSSCFSALPCWIHPSWCCTAGCTRSMHLARSGIEQRDICRAPPRIHACDGLSGQNMHGRTREEVDGSCF
jgi:hypothetical protein